MEDKPVKKRIRKSAASLGRPLHEPSVPEKQESKLLYSPSSPVNSLIIEALAAGEEHIFELPERKKQVSNSSTYTALQQGSKVRIVKKTKDGSYTVEFSDSAMLSNTPARKLLNLCLIKANQQAVHDHKMTQSTVTFPLQDMIDLGMYSTPQSALAGFKAGMRTLCDIYVEVDTKERTKGGHIFRPWDIQKTNGQYTVLLEDGFDWAILTQSFMLLPATYFRLSSNAAELYNYIFYIARQRGKDISSKGFFTISLRAIHARLNLPSEVGCKKPKQYIRDPIESAIEEIEVAHYEDFGNDYLQLELHYNEKGNTQDYLDNGYLKVYLREDFAEATLNIRAKKSKIIETSKKRRDKIRDEAAIRANAKALEKHLETDENEGERS